MGGGPVLVMTDANTTENERVILVLRLSPGGTTVGSWGSLAPRWREAAAGTIGVSGDGAAGAPRRPAPTTALVRALNDARGPLDDEAVSRLIARLDDGGADWEERIGGADEATLIVTSHGLADGDSLITVTERLPPDTIAASMDDATIKTILDLLPATVSVKDARRRYVFVNRAWEAYADTPRAAVLGKPHEEVVAPELDPRSRGHHSRDIADRDGHVLTTGRALLGQEERYVLANGLERTLLSNKLPLFDRSGSVSGVLSITMDVSDMVNAQTLLEQARRAAETANRAKSGFLATISHELRTPLNGIVGIINLLELTRPTERQRALIAALTDSALELSSLVESILEFAQTEPAEPHPTPEIVDLTAMIEGIVAPLADRAHAKGLSMRVEMPPPPPITAYLERIGVGRVLSELIGNAITFTEEGSITVRVIIDRRNPDESVLQIDVIDTGIGVRADDVSKLFTPLFQADQSATRRHGGIGMGLAVCRRMVEAMGGTLRMVSPDHRGSVFRMRIGIDVVDGSERELGVAMDDTGLTVLCGRNGNALGDFRRRLEGFIQPFVEIGSAPEIGGDPAQALAVVARNAAKGRRTGLLIIHGADMAVGDGPLYDRISALFGMPRIPIIGIGIDPRVVPQAVHLPGDVDDDTLASAIATAMAATGEVDKDARPLGPPLGRPVGSDPGNTNRIDDPPPNGERIPNTADMETTDAMRILLAEDNEVNQLVAVGMLNSLGYEVDVVTNGEDAVDALSRGGYAAVLMDIRMPVMDGLEATRRIRALGGAAAAIPIIAVTANAMRGDQESCLSVGMNDYLAKPIRLATLEATLRRWLPGA